MPRKLPDKVWITECPRCMKVKVTIESYRIDNKWTHLPDRSSMRHIDKCKGFFGHD